MNWWIFGGVVVGVVVLCALLQRFHLIDLSGRDKPRSSGNGSGLMGIGDEIFAPARHEAAIELDRQTILPAPAPLAGDRANGDPLAAVPDRAEDKGPYRGQVTIDLSRRRP